MKKILISLLGLAAFTVQAFAADIAPAGYYNLRNMALGNSTFNTNSVDTALFTNPALMQLIEDGKFTFLGFANGMNDEGEVVSDVMMEMADEISQEKVLPEFNKKFSELTEMETIEYIKQKQAKVRGKALTGFANLSSLAYTGPGFGTGIFMSGNANNAEIKTDPTGAPKIIVNGSERLEIPLGIAFSLGEDKNIHIGASLRYINFINFDTELGAIKLLEFSQDSNQEFTDLLNGTLNHGFGLNLGAAYTFEESNTTIGLGLQNLWSSINTYNLPSEFEASDILSGGSEKIGTYSLMPNVRLGVTTKPLNWIEVSGELDNLLSKNLDGRADTRDTNLFKKVHLGTEVSPLKLVPDINKFIDLRLRLGVNQGYLTYGIGTSLLFLNFEYAHFTEEAGYTLGMDPNPINAYSLFVRF